MTSAERERFIEDHAYLARVTAGRYRSHMPPGVAWDDLHGEALLALCRAADSYDRGRGALFSTWAVHWMRGAILEYLRREDPLSRLDRDRVQALGDAEALGGTDAEIAARLGTEPSGLAELRALRERGFRVPLDAPSHRAHRRAGGPTSSLVRVIDRFYADDDTQTEALARLERHHLVREVRRCLRMLTESERRVIDLRYGRGYTLVRCARELGRSRSRASQLCSSAERKLRAWLPAV